MLSRAAFFLLISARAALKNTRCLWLTGDSSIEARVCRHTGRTSKTRNEKAGVACKPRRARPVAHRDFVALLARDNQHWPSERASSRHATGHAEALGIFQSCPSFNPALATEKPVPAKYPVPRHVSSEAQAILGRPVLMEGRLLRPSSPTQWQQLKRQQNLRVAPQIDRLKNIAQLTIETTQLGGVPVRIVTPNKLPESKRDKVLIALHGGAYVFFGGEASLLEAASIAMAGHYKVIAVDYRMPPEYPFPAAVDDGVAVYQAVLDTTAAENIAVFGTSAGGSLTASVIIRARDQGMPLPAAAYMNTPWADLSKTGDSYVTNEAVDPVLPVYGGVLAAAAEIYAGEAGLKHPLVSPVYADYHKGFPPSLLITGTRDLLLSSTVRLHRALREAGVYADLHVFDAMWHAFTANTELPEANSAQGLVLKFLDQYLQVSRTKVVAGATGSHEK